MQTWNLSLLPPEMREISRELLPELDGKEAENGILLLAEEEPSLHLSLDEERRLHIGYSKKYEFCRGLGLAKQILADGREIREQAEFDWLTYMPDVTNNNTPNPAFLKKSMRIAALMGYNSFLLYMEDAFDLPGHPYFGHLRARYSREELREIVRYGELLGMTVMPFFETLGHMEKTLRWKCYDNMKDTKSVLYVGKEESYQFLEEVLTYLCDCFPSKRFHLGMDEPDDLGLGKRLQEEGYVFRNTLSKQHLQRVDALCKKLGISPTISSDMFFCALDPDGRYMTDSVIVPQEVLDSLPDGFTLQFWHYYNCGALESSRRVYDHMLEQHLRFHAPISYMAATWSFTGLTPNNRYSMMAAEYQTKVLRKAGIRDVTLSVWGCECSQMAALPTDLIFADRFYGREDPIDKHFEQLFGMALEDYLTLDEVNFVPNAEPLETYGARAHARYLFYSDPLGGLLDSTITPEHPEHFRKTSEKLAQFCSHPKFGYIFETMLSFSRILEKKTALVLAMRDAYSRDDRAELAKIADSIDGLLAEMELFRQKNQEQWILEYRNFGAECFDRRIGGMTARIESTQAVIRAYLAGESERLEALDEPMLNWECRKPGEPLNPAIWLHTVTYAENVAPGVL